MSVGMPQTLLLQEFGELLFSIFGEMSYQVGSSLNNKTGWRDVDVRLIIPDEKYESMGLGKPGNEHHNGKWRMITKHLSALGQQMTGLPIDFQIQQQSYANEKFGRKEHVRSALFIVKE